MTQAVHYRSFIKLAVLLLALLLVSCDRKSTQEDVQAVLIEPADLVLVNGGIYTVDKDRSTAEAAAVRDGVFVMVGDNAEIETLIGPETRTIDLAGKWALPGFHDAHVHPGAGGGGEALLGCDLRDMQSVDAIISRVTECAAEAEDGWLQGYAFDLSFFGLNGPHKSLLDAIATDRPILLWSSDYHSVWVNSKALELAGITAATPDPELGHIERDTDGSATGTLRESAQKLVQKVIPEPTLEYNVAALKTGIGYLNSFGITSLINVSVGLNDYESYRELEREGALTARVVTAITFGGGFAKHYGEEFEQVLAGRNEYESDRVNHDSIKLYLDGGFEGKTAALLEPYLDSEGGRGELIFSQDELNAAVSRFDAMGLQVHMHAIGDRAVRSGLDAIEATRKANGPGDNRHTISHLEMIHADDLGRFAALDTTANFQALWAYRDESIPELYLPVLGEDRVEGMYPIAGIVRSGGRIVGGSDWDVTSPNPMKAIEVAMRRQDPNEDSGPVLNENERVSLSTMIDAYTINGAWLMHQEDRVGSIEVGKRADIVVLDRDLFRIPPTEISETQVVMTLLDGKIIYFNQELRN
jgi:predicted amidohydrolase YtcJ